MRGFDPSCRSKYCCFSIVSLQHPVYIRKAFEYARTLTKKKLELRDSGFEFPTDSKYNAFYELAVHLKKMNAPVDVIGFQTHIDLERNYDWEGYTNNIKRYNLSVTKNIMNMRLSWTDQSTNEQGFIVDRKTADTDWQEIVRVGVNMISYTDIVPLYNTEYSYRVSSYALGKSAPSNVITVTSPLDPNTGLSENSDNLLYSIFPNPVQDKFTLISPVNSEVKIYDIQGVLMLERKNCSSSESFDINSFSKGIYFLQTSGNKKMNRIKLIKN